MPLLHVNLNIAISVQYKKNTILDKYNYNHLFIARMSKALPKVIPRCIAAAVLFGGIQQVCVRSRAEFIVNH